MMQRHLHQLSNFTVTNENHGDSDDKREQDAAHRPAKLLQMLDKGHTPLRRH